MKFSTNLAGKPAAMKKIRIRNTLQNGAYRRQNETALDLARQLTEGVEALRNDLRIGRNAVVRQAIPSGKLDNGEVRREKPYRAG